MLYLIDNPQSLSGDVVCPIRISILGHGLPATTAVEEFPVGSEHDEDIDVVISWLDNIAERCALERYFRPEGHYGDGVGVIPIDIGNKVRLYCLRLSDKILVFGNGGVKDAPTWEESEQLAPYVKLLIDTSRFISSRIKDGTIVLVDKEIVGNLNFSRDETE